MKTLIAFMQLYIANTNTHNFNKVRPMLHQNALYWFDEKEYSHTADIQAAFITAWQYLPDEVYIIKNLRWLSFGSNSATCIYEYEWKGTHNNKSMKGSGRGTNLLVKEKGEWKIMHEHLSKIK